MTRCYLEASYVGVTIWLGQNLRENIRRAALLPWTHKMNRADRGKTRVGACYGATHRSRAAWETCTGLSLWGISTTIGSGGFLAMGIFFLSRIKPCSSAWSNSRWNIDHCLGKRELGPSTRVGWIFYVVRMSRCTQENVHLVEGKSSCSQNLEIS